jgi:signal transduction histidine kinase
LLTQAWALDRLSQAYQAIGQTDAAVVHLRKAEQLKDSIYSLSKVRDMTKKELNHEFDKEREIQELQQEKTAAIAALELNRQRGLKWALAIGLLLLILLGAFVFMRLKEQQRRRSESLRQKIASDLHDDVGSTLSSISILSESYLRNGEMDIDKTRFGDIGHKVRTALDSISDIVWSVNPENDSMEKLLARMSGFASEMLENESTEFLFQVAEGIDAQALPIEKRKDFYLIFKEAIHNCAKYAHAKRIEVHLEVKNNVLTMEIQDDGVGFDPQNVHQNMGGNGLKNMQRRAAAMEGTFSIHSSPGEGVTLHVAVPLVP